MPRTRRSRLLAADPQALWAVVGDPHHLARWWPRVVRVEALNAAAFTEVLVTGKGRQLRADFTVTASEPERLIAWRQELEGTPFARFLARAHTEVRLEPSAGATRITLQVDEAPHGFFPRFGGLLFGRAARRRLDDALDALQQIVA